MRLLSMASEILPLGALFVGTHYGSIFIGASASVITAGIVVLITRLTEQRWAHFAVFSVLVSCLFTACALIFGDSLFIKIQPSLFNGLFALILLAGWFRNIAMMKLFFGAQFSLTERTWLTLSGRWGWFFLSLVIANEWAWRSLTDTGWVNFKIFVVTPITALFMLAQLPITLRGRIQDNPDR